MKNRFRFKHLWLLLLFAALINCYRSNAQATISIEECYVLARQQYPLIKQLDLIKQSKDYAVENAGKGYLPQLLVNGQATYQSAVTEIPVKIPGMNIEALDKDQYRIYAEINQPVYDNGVIKQQKKILEANAAIDQQNTEVALYKLKERINQLYFGILVIDEQLKQVVILKKDIDEGIKKVNAAIANGTSFKSNRDVLLAELLKTDQRVIELKSSRKAYLNMLGLFTGQPLDIATQLQKPENKLTTSAINRPELTLYDYQARTIESQKKLLQAKSLPRFGLFVQGGYGKPGLNMLSNEFASYYIAGLRLNWSLTPFYTMKKEKKMIDLNHESIRVQKETFLLNTNMQIQQQDAEIEKMGQLIATDEQIIKLRNSVKTAASAQLENGVITTNDYLREVNAEDQARQNLSLHQVQLLMAQYNQQVITGN